MPTSRRAYEERRARYVTPERRHIEQIVFPNMPRRRKPPPSASPRARAFVEIAKELGKTEKDIDLGTVTKAGMIDRAVADAAFALKEGEVSAPVQGRFGTVLVQVLKIEPEQVRPFEEVAARAQAGAGDRSAPRPRCSSSTTRSRMRALRARRSPRPREALKLSSPHHRGDRPLRPRPVRHAGPAFPTSSGCCGGIHHRGRRRERSAAGRRTAMSGTTSPASRRRASAPLDEVKEQVEARWREQEIATRLKAKATEMLDKLKAGERRSPSRQPPTTSRSRP